MKTIRLLPLILMSFMVIGCSFQTPSSSGELPISASLSNIEESSSASPESSFSSESSLEPATILSVQGGELNEADWTIWMLVEPNTINVSLSALITVSPNSKWKLYRGETEIPTKTATTKDGSLIDGENPFYIVVSSADGLIENVYELIIYRSFSVTITYTFQGYIIGHDTADTGYEFALPEDYPINGYTFSHWTYEGEKTKALTPWRDVALEAVASANSYLITFDPRGGQVDCEYLEVTFGEAVVLPTPKKEGYHFGGWMAEGWWQVRNGIWTIPSDVVLKALWNPIVYTITYILNGGENNPQNPSTYTIEDEVVFVPPLTDKTGFSFAGWSRSDGSHITGLPAGSLGDISIEAIWSAVQHSLVVESSDSSKGTVSILQGSGYSFEDVVVVADACPGFAFAGWYKDDVIVSSDAAFAFEMPNDDLCLLALFRTEDEQWKYEHGIIPSFDANRQVLRYGLYPKSHVSDPSLIDSLDNLERDSSTGWYYFDGNYYEKRVALIEVSGWFQQFFEDGQEIVRGESYWFLCEPFDWIPFSANANESVYVPTCIFDAEIFDHTSNVYTSSELRTWMNDCLLSNTLLLGGNTGFWNGELGLLSNAQWNEELIACNVSDFTKARTAHGSGNYWTKTAHSDTGRGYYVGKFVYTFRTDGARNYGTAVNTYGTGGNVITELVGVRPTMTISKTALDEIQSSRL